MKLLDMGFRTSTMVSPELLRQKILPWHNAGAKIAHDHGKPYLLHTCREPAIAWEQGTRWPTTYRWTAT